MTHYGDRISAPAALLRHGMTPDSSTKYRLRARTTPYTPAAYCGRFSNCHDEGRCVYQASIDHGVYFAPDRKCEGPFLAGHDPNRLVSISVSSCSLAARGASLDA